MRYFILCLAFVLFVGFYSFTAVNAIPTGITERVSVSSNGSQGNGDSYQPDLSADGRYVVFASAADNLVAGDTNGYHDIFVYDRETDTIGRVNIRTGGELANNQNFTPVISDDGRIVVFASLASNLVDGDSNGLPDIFVHDRQTGQTSLINVVIGGTANGNSSEPDISGDGRYVTFTSFASNLVGGDNNNRSDIFRWDRLGLTMERISVDSNEAEANDNSRAAAISGDGQYIVFVSEAGNLVAGDGNKDPDIFLRDTAAGTTSRVNIADGTNAEANGDSWDPAISANGQYIVFVSLANNLVSGDGNGYADVFMRNLNTSQTRLVSLASNGGQANDWSEEPTVSGNGRFVTFQSEATNLIPGNPANVSDVFIRDAWDNVLVLGCVTGSGERGNGSSNEPVLSADGRALTYSSLATNLVPGDSNNWRDIFACANERALPTLSVNYNTGAPGSYFVFSGASWAVNGTAVVQANGVTLGNVSTDSSGNLIFQIISEVGTEQGGYLITVSQGSDIRTVYFTVRAGYPLRPGSGGGFTLPNGIALTESIYLPLIQR